MAKRKNKPKTFIFGYKKENTITAKTSGNCFIGFANVHNHKWYYQVQGQLHITQRQLCYFSVWTGAEIPIRVEKIYRDDGLKKWKIK